jgi:NADPH:quinone reductase-like Zn-dependent oxidoreductase
MKAITYNRFGGTEVLTTSTISLPSVSEKQVLVKVKAVSINPLDWKIRKGEMKLMSGSKFPKGIGVDFSGIIEQTGAAVTGFKKGDEVFGAVNGMKEGALAEYVAMPVASLWKKPAAINFVQAASIPIVGAGATLALEKIGSINSQTEILINGATGGFGMFLLQLLKQKGARITAVANTAGVEYAKQWGADHTIDYTAQNVLTLGKTYDVVVDLSGKMGFANATKIMKQQAIFINPTPQPADILFSPIKNLFRGKKHKVLLSNPSAKNIPQLLTAIEKGLHIEVSKVYAFNQATEAYQYAEKGGYIGKVAIAINEAAHSKQ